MKKVLITGSQGLIGRELVKKHKSLGDDVIGYDILSDENGEHWHWNSIRYNNYDIIHHTASKCVIREVIKAPKQAMENNDITFRVMELARHCRPQKLILYSSNRVTANIENPYVSCKKFMENLALAYKNCYDIDSIIIRPETIWGNKANDTRVIPNWINSAKNNMDINVYGYINKQLSPLYIDDFMNVLEGIINCYDINKNKTFTITGSIRTAKEITETIKRFYDSKSNINYLEPEKTQPQEIVERDVCEFRVRNNLVVDLREYESKVN
jgi:nucleoside-diphosphate-sugar epimerase